VTPAGEARWPLLFSPLRLGPLTLPNRIVMPAMDPSLADAAGIPTAAMVEHYAARARGGAGLVITGNVAVSAEGRLSPWMGMLTSASHEDGFRRVTEAVHAAQGRVLLQLSHAGRQTVSQFAGEQPLAPSPIPCPVMRDPPREMTADDIERTLEAFVRATRRARDAGADGVEFHMAHGYLVCQFLSPYSNHRCDAWGGDVDGRARFAVEIVRRARAAVGPDFVLQCRLSADERVDGGITPPLALEYAERLVAAGADALSISACNYESYRYNMPAYYLPEATYADLAANVRAGLRSRGVEVPIIGVGRFRRAEVAEAALERGDCDLVAMGRALIADPDLPRRLRAGTPDAVRPCVACNRCAEAVTQGPLRCLVNPDAGRPPATQDALSAPRRVLIVGGGPAGLTFAATSARRGHSVVVVEAGQRAGGKVWASAAPPMKQDFSELAAWLVYDAVTAGVRIETGRALAPQAFAEWSAGYDVVVLATGAEAAPTPAIPGLDQHPSVLHPEASLEPGRVQGAVLVLGGGPEGCEVADALAERPGVTTVHLVELRPKLGLGLPSSVRGLLQGRLQRAPIVVHTSRTVGALSATEVVLHDRRGRPTETLPGVDHIVLAIGVRPSTAWSDVSDDPRVLFVGDARDPATILEAIAVGHRAALDLK